MMVHAIWNNTKTSCHMNIKSNLYRKRDVSPGEPLESVPTLPVFELVCVSRACSLSDPDERWYQHRSSSDTAALFPPPSLPTDGVLTI